MKKVVALFFVFCLLCFAAAAQAKTLVVWFSCTGNTEALAATAAEALGADLWQIVPQIPYSETDLNYNDNTCRANKEQNDKKCRPALAEQTDIETYGTILIAYPIWWGEEPRIIDTWIESVDLSGKTAAAICTSGGSGIQTSYAHLQEKTPDTLWLDAKRFSASTTAEELSEWFSSIGMLKTEKE